MPEVAFRFLHHRDRPRHAVFVSVVLCPYKTEPNAVKFVEPLVSAGWVKYGADIPRKRWRRYFWARMILWAKGEHDGEPIRWTALHEKESVEECCLAKPLVNIQDEAALVHQILAPLLQSLELPLPAGWVVLAPSDPPAEPT